MRPPIAVLRLLSIIWVLARYNLGEILQAAPQPWRSVAWLFRAATWPLWLGQRKSPRGKRITLALERLGPLFVKLGQLLSTRRDLIPGDISEHLVRLRERVRPFEYSKVKLIVESSFGQGLDEIFDDFSVEPIAAASIAQVHTARLKGAGREDSAAEVVVKVLRPNIRRVIARDLYVLELIFGLAQRHFRQYHHLNLLDISAELARVLSCETDLRTEAANCSVLRRQSSQSSLLYVPKIHWDHVRRKVLVMERVHGIAVDDLAKLREAGVDPRELAIRGVDLFIEQVFDQDIFHADMHPGNLFVDASNPKEPSFIAVDFGMVGSLNDHDRQYLARNLVAFFRRDYAQVARLHAASGWLLQDQGGLHDFASALRNVCEPIFEKNPQDISFGDLLQRLFETARIFEIQIQPQLLLLQKTFINVEGIGRYLYTELNLWTTARSRIERWVAKQLGVSHNAAILRRTVEDALWSVPHLGLQAQAGVRRLSRTLDAIERVDSMLGANRADRPRRRAGHWFLAVGCTLWICASLIYVFAPTLPDARHYFGMPWPSLLGFTLGTLLLALSWLGRWRQAPEPGQGSRRHRRLH